MKPIEKLYPWEKGTHYKGAWYRRIWEDSLRIIVNNNNYTKYRVNLPKELTNIQEVIKNILTDFKTHIQLVQKEK